jgi:hypothetical protein
MGRLRGRRKIRVQIQKYSYNTRKITLTLNSYNFRRNVSEQQKLEE